MSLAQVTVSQLTDFIYAAQEKTWFADGELAVPERTEFLEYHHADGDWDYRDSFTGLYQSHGTEVIKYKGQIVWEMSYRGGMEAGEYERWKECFDFLKAAVRTKEPGFNSFRGPHAFTSPDFPGWRYEYDQIGEWTKFMGAEKIWFEDKLVFTHDVIGGTIEYKET